ncbi:hypothetical protein [Halomonas jincaotanensis]|uniref:hypothetical protein n=1 Tax=Halomonas jincaotanensis TaxID=2810616 RepID=UPI003872BBB7
MRGWRSIVRRSLNMFTLIAIGTGAALVYSLLATIVPGIFPETFRQADGSVAVYFEAAAVIVVLVLLGQVLELRAHPGVGRQGRRRLRARGDPGRCGGLHRLVAVWAGAAHGLRPDRRGMLLSPIIAAAAMSLSSVIAIANALRLRMVALKGSANPHRGCHH